MLSHKYWICGRVLGEEWELQGVFPTEEKAIDACKDSSYFVGPVRLNLDFPRESTSWQGSYYPIKT